jgi:hypothetical protein
MFAHGASGSTFEFCTITDNTVPSGQAGAGISIAAVPPDNLNMQGTLIYGDLGGTDIDNSDSSNPTFFFGDHNLIGTIGTTVHVPVDTINCDPLLGPLANNGGLTQTHALLSGSCAIGAGPTVVPGFIPTDQRGTGFPRKNSGLSDIGAFETQPSDRIFENGFEW